MAAITIPIPMNPYPAIFSNKSGENGDEEEGKDDGEDEGVGIIGVFGVTGSPRNENSDISTHVSPEYFGRMFVKVIAVVFNGFLRVIVESAVAS